MLRRRRRSGGGGAVNRPNITVPAAQAILLSSAPLVFATSIAVSDAVETSLTVSLAFPGGTITLDGTTGLSFSVGDGTADAAMTFSGTITNINNALSGMSVTAGSTGDRTLSITATNTTGSNNVSVAVQFGAAPAFSVAPAISGTLYVGQTLTRGGQTVTGYPTPTLSDQWKNAGSNISGATNPTYVVQAGDLSDAITDTVTATNVYGSANSTTAAVTITAPLNISAVEFEWTSDGTTTPHTAGIGFNSGEVLLGDIPEIRLDTATTFDSGNYQLTSNTLDAGELSGLAADFSIASLTNTTWYGAARFKRVYHTDGSFEVSAWSDYDSLVVNVATAASFTISATQPDFASKGYASATHTFTGVDFLAGDALIFVAQDTTGRLVSSVTVGGFNASEVLAVGPSGATDLVAVWRYNGITAGNHSVVITLDVVTQYMGMMSGTLINGNASVSDDATFYHGGGQNQPHVATSTLVVPTDGIGIAVMYSGTGGTTWNTGTEVADKESSGLVLSVATFAAGTSLTPSVNGHAYQQVAIAAVAFAPA
jgi:hypothetical protein